MDNELPVVLDYLTAKLGDDDYLVGNAFSIADIATCSPFVNMRIGKEDVDSARWPKFSEYLDDRPS